MRRVSTLDRLGSAQGRTWSLVLPSLLLAAAIVASSVLLLRAVDDGLLDAAGPALLLYGSLYGCYAVYYLRREEPHRAASTAWEAVIWGGIGGLLAVVFRGAFASLPLLLIGAAAAMIEGRPRQRRWIDRVSLEAAALLAGLALLAPVLWMVAASLRAPGLPTPTRLEWWPAEASTANYALLAELIPLGRYLRNSVLITLLAVPTSLLVAAAAGFSLAQMPVRWSRAFLALSLVGMAMPGMALWLPRFLVFRSLGVLNTPLALLAPALLGGSPLCVLLLYRAFRRVPRELWDQARIDGASPLRMWWHIGLPQVRGIMLALSALVFGLFWGNFIDPLLYVSDGAWHTLPVGLQSLQQLARSDWPVLMAGCTLMLLPPVALFVLVKHALLDDPAEKRGK